MTLFGTLNKDGKITNEYEVDLSETGPEDPIAFAYGIFHGSHDFPLPDPNSDEYEQLDPEYLRGYAKGQKEKQQ